MKNGKLFSTGNHPVEMLVPMLHFRSAGFDMDICTPTGKEVQIEQWAMPKKDKAVGDIYNGFRQQLKEPLSLQELGVKADSLGEHYAAIFIPGGHGAMLGLPANEDLKILLQAAHKQKLFFLSICHGPAALLAAGINEEKSDFLFKGYEITAFPDAVDRQTPMIGYMPGHLSWQFGAALEERGVKILNKKADKSCHRDRNLITGASPDAADAFGKMATEAMLDSLV
jgi:molecular chaperone Hsp31 and glyoxalase 3